jgi:hypothetical protein
MKIKHSQREDVPSSEPRRKKMRLTELTAKEIFSSYLQNLASIKNSVSNSASGEHQKSESKDDGVNDIYSQFVDSPSRRFQERKVKHYAFCDSLKRNIIHHSKVLGRVKHQRGEGIQQEQNETELINAIFLQFLAIVSKDYLEEDTETPLPVLVMQDILIRLFQPDTQGGNLWKNTLFDSIHKIDENEDIDVATFASILLCVNAKNDANGVQPAHFVYVCLGYIISQFMVQLSIARLNEHHILNQMTTVDWNSVNQDIQKYLKNSWISNHAYIANHVNLGIVMFALDCMDIANQDMELEHIDCPLDSIRDCTLLDWNVTLKGLYVSYVTEALRQDNWYVYDAFSYFFGFPTMSTIVVK